MIVNTKKFVDNLINNYHIEEFCGVSDSTLKYLINEVTNRGIYTPFTNEGSAVAYAAGRTISGHRTAVLMQNSGLTNAASPISSLTSLYGIPMIYIVGWRGKPLSKDEPQHKYVGANTISIIKSISGPAVSIASVYDDGTLNFNGDLVSNKDQVFIMINPNTFSEVLLNNETKVVGINRLECISKLKELADSDTYFLSTTGYTSRELMSLNEEDSHNFYMLGSMGCITPFTYGLVVSHPLKKFVILDGDGSFLMRPDATIVSDLLFPEYSVFHIIFNNKSHLSTGGQELFMSNYISSCFNIPRVDDINTIINLYKDWLTDPRTVRVICDTSKDHKNNLPRPTKEPEQLLDNFMQELNKNE